MVPLWAFSPPTFQAQRHLSYPCQARCASRKSCCLFYSIHCAIRHFASFGGFRGFSDIQLQSRLGAITRIHIKFAKLAQLYCPAEKDLHASLIYYFSLQISQRGPNDNCGLHLHGFQHDFQQRLLYFQISTQVLAMRLPRGLIN